MLKNDNSFYHILPPKLFKYVDTCEHICNIWYKDASRYA